MNWLLATGCWLLVFITSASAGLELIRLGLGLIGILRFLRARSTPERFPDILTLPDREELPSRAIPAITSEAPTEATHSPRGRRPGRRCARTSRSSLRASVTAPR